MGACAVTALTALTAGGGAPARAAGVGYGGGALVARDPPRPAFQAVVTARTVGRAGGSVTGRVAGGTLRVVIPAGSSSRALTVADHRRAQCGGRAAPARRAPARPDRRHRRHRGQDGGAGRRDVEGDHGRPCRIGPSPAGDIVVVYDGATGRFTRIAATVVRGRITIRLSSGEALAVLRP